MISGIITPVMKRLLKAILITFALILPAPLMAAEGGLFDLKSVDMGNISDKGPAEFEIELKNITGSTLNINKVDTSCGCTVVNAPEGPIMPGETARVRVTLDTRGKMGDISKELKLFTSGGSDPHVLTLKGRIEHFGDTLPDPSVVFQGDCASCHVGKNIERKQGPELYNSVCYLCHKNGLGGTGTALTGIENIIAAGIPGTSMPGFSKESGGPLSDEQVKSLSTYVRKNYYPGR